MNFNLDLWDTTEAKEFGEYLMQDNTKARLLAIHL